LLPTPPRVLSNAGRLIPRSPVPASIPSMSRLLSKIARSLARDRALPLSARLAKGGRYVAATTLGPLYLGPCDAVGARPRAMGRPVIRNAGRITIGDDLVLNSRHAPCELVTGPGGALEIGHGVAINFGTYLGAASRVTIGDGASFGPYCIVADDEGSGDASTARPIDIGARVWLAGRVTVLPGARIGEGSVVTAGSVVDGEIPAGVVAGGNPARVLRSLTASADDACEGRMKAAHGEDAAHMRLPQAPSPCVVPDAPFARGVILADFTTGELAARLRTPDGGPALDVVETPYGQVAPLLLAAPPEGATDFAVVWTRAELVSGAYQRLLAHEPVDAAALDADVDAFCDLVRRGGAHYRSTFVATWTRPASHRGLGMLDARPGGVAWALARMNARLMDRLAEVPNVFVLDAQRWVDMAGRAPSAAKAWYLGKIPFAGEVFAEAARDVRGALAGLAGQARKLLVLDLDDTLWGGIVGDAGWEGLRLGGHDAEGEAFVDFQRAVQRLTRRGVVLAIASKNTESVALDAMRSHPAMVLKPEDFVGWRINWNDKARNIADLAAELNLGLQSVVFIDDNPVERARVREALPEVLVPEWPVDKLQYPAALAELRCFDAPALSREDADRTRMYAAEQQREAERRDVERRDVGSVDEWLAGLDIRVKAEPLGAANLARTAQLLNKTNQLNLATRRLTEGELTAWAAGDGRELWALSVGDRFGDAGLTGILGLERDGDVCRVTDFVLSCRVMGRRVEETLAHLAVTRGIALGARRVEARYAPTAKNAPTLAFLARSGFTASDDATLFTWDAAQPYALPACITLTGANGA